MAAIDLPEGEYTAAIDSIQDGYATVFFECDGEEISNAVLDASAMPADAQHADAILSVTITDGELEHATYKPEESTECASAAQDRFGRLANRLPSDEEN